MIEDLPDHALPALPSYVPDRGYSERVRARCHAALGMHGERAGPAQPLEGAGWAALVEATSIIALTLYLVVIVSTAVRLVAL